VLISIITINFNDVEGLKKTMTSVFNQTFSNIEYIIIDGGSTDGSKEYIETNKDSLAYWVSEPDSGIYNAMNKGIAASNGNYLLFLNSGDTLHSKTILAEVNKHFSGNKDIYYGNIMLCKNGKEKIDIYPNTLSISFLYRKSLPHPASFIKRSLFDKVSLYNEKLMLVSDWEFFMCAILKYSATTEHIDIIVSDFDLNGMSNNFSHRNIMDNERKIVMETHFPLIYELLENFNKKEKLLSNNRFKMLSELEKTTAAQKLNSLWLRCLLLILKGKTLKNLKNKEWF